MIAGTTLLDYTNLFSSNDYKKNDKVIYKYFKDKYGKRKCKMKSFPHITCKTKHMSSRIFYIKGR